MSRTLTVATYNIHGCRGRDRRCDVSRVAMVIRELEADVVGLQEIDSRGPGSRSAQLESLAEATGMATASGPTMRHPDGDYGNALLSRHRLTDVRHCDLALAPFEPRGAVMATVTAADVRFRAVSTHLGLRRAERATQARQLLAWLGELPAAPLIVLGDFNEWRPTGAGLRLLRAQLGPAAAVRSFPTRAPLLALDRVFARGPQVLAVRAHRSPAARLASDHLPVVATLRWTGRRAGELES